MVECAASAINSAESAEKNILRPVELTCLDCKLVFTKSFGAIKCNDQLGKQEIVGPIAQQIIDHHLDTGVSTGVLRGDQFFNVTFTDVGETVRVEANRYHVTLA